MLSFFMARVVGSLANPPLLLEELTHLRQNHNRVLAAITGVWDWNAAELNDTLGTARIRNHAACIPILHRILNNYVHVCEAGFEVHVVLVTYTQRSDNNMSIPLPPLTDIYCDRLGTSLPIAIKRFDWQSLPAGAFGTAGALAHRHRQVFADLSSRGYDCFIQQEDDHMVKTHQIRYFMKWARQSWATKAYPTFMRHEVFSHLDRRAMSEYPSTMVHSSTRLDFSLQRFQGATWLQELYIGGVMHMMSSSMLRHYLRQDYNTSTLGDYPHRKNPNATYEFNPYFNRGFLMDTFQFIGIPIQDLWRALLQHATTRYTNQAFTAQAANVRMINTLQFEQVLQQCTGELVKLTPDAYWHSVPSEIRFNPSSPTPCAACMNQGRTARLLIDATSDYTQLATRAFSLGAINVTVSCV